MRIVYPSTSLVYLVPSVVVVALGFLYYEAVFAQVVFAQVLCGASYFFVVLVARPLFVYFHEKPPFS